MEATAAQQEPDLTVQELAERLRLSPQTIRRLLSDDPDVKRIIGPSWGMKRTYVTLRIPMSVANRLNRRLTQPTPKPVKYGIKKRVIRRVPVQKKKA